MSQTITSPSDDLKTNTDNINSQSGGVEINIGMIDIPDLGRLDPKLYEVAVYIITNQDCNTSVIQSKFVTGPNRTARIIDQLEYIGIVKRTSNFKIDVIVDSVDRLNYLLEQLQTVGVITNSVEDKQKSQGKIENSEVDGTRSIGFVDPKLHDIADIIVKEQCCSVSFIQRKLSIGYERTSHIIDQLELI